MDIKFADTSLLSKDVSKKVLFINIDEQVVRNSITFRYQDSFKFYLIKEENCLPECIVLDYQGEYHEENMDNLRNFLKERIGKEDVLWSADAIKTNGNELWNDSLNSNSGSSTSVQDGNASDISSRWASAQNFMFYGNGVNRGATSSFKWGRSANESFSGSGTNNSGMSSYGQMYKSSHSNVESSSCNFSTNKSIVGQGSSPFSPNNSKDDGNLEFHSTKFVYDPSNSEPTPTGGGMFSYGGNALPQHTNWGSQLTNPKANHTWGEIWESYCPSIYSRNSPPNPTIWATKQESGTNQTTNT